MPDSDASGERITVTYAASPAVLCAPLTPHFTSLLQQQLPLRNLHWRPSQATLDSFASRAAHQAKGAAHGSSTPGSTIRTIQNLEVALKPLTDEIKRWRGDPGYAEQPIATELLARPFVHLYLVVCEDNEHYRVTVRNEIRSWISSLSFFHTQPAAAAPHASIRSPVVSTNGSGSRSSFPFGRSATNASRPGTPQTGADGSSVSQASASIVPTQSASLLPKYPSEPEYLIVLISPPEGSGISGMGTPGNSTPEPKSGMGRLITKSKTNVLDKIKADFNTSKKEHVLQVARLPPVSNVPLGRSGLHSMDPTIWAELLTKMKEAASSTFTTAVEAQEDEILRCGATRGQESWDFCSYFLAKDSLARTLEGVGLKDDAVGQYEDLEIVFINAMQNGAVAFAPIGGDSPNDDSLPLLDVGKKPYQELIRSREISLFDFRCYLFARKSVLLGKLGRVATVMREAPLFIGAIGRMMSLNKGLSRQWIESWMFSAALDVVEQCQAWLILRGHTVSADDDQFSPAFNSNKSELLDLARRQLDRIGIHAGHLPAFAPFDVSSETDPATAGQHLPGLLPKEDDNEVLQDAKKPSRPELVQAIESQEYFDSQYLALCERILTGWSGPMRLRSRLRLRTILAAFDFHRHKYQSAFDSLTLLTQAYADSKFDVMQSHCLAIQLECHARLQRPADHAWITSIIAALKLTKTTFAAIAAQPTLQRWQDPQHLMRTLYTALADIDKEIPVPEYPLFSIVVTDTQAKLANGEDGSLLRADVLSALPFDQEVDDVRVCLTSASNSSMWYTSGKTTLQPGSTKLELFCPSPSWGVYTVDVTQIRVSKLIFQYAGTKANVVRVPKDGASVGVELELPRQIDLDKQRMVEIKLFTGRNRVNTAEIAVLVPSEGCSAIDPSHATIISAESPNAIVVDTNSSVSTVTVKNLSKDTTNTILVPLLILPESGSLSTVVSVTYTVASDGLHTKGRKRVLSKSAIISTALPLGVNVQDFFRSSCLLSKFTISAAAGGGSLRLRPVQLALDSAAESDVPYNIVSCSTSRETTVTPRQPATYVFRIAKQDVEHTTATRLRLAVEFRTLKEDAIATTLATLERLLSAQGEKASGLATGTPLRRLLETVLVAYVGDRLNLPAYSIASEIRTGAFDALWWKREQIGWGHDLQPALDLTSLIKDVLETIASASTHHVDVVTGEWRKLTIPVDVPSMDIVHTVSMEIASSASAAALVMEQGGPFPGYQASIMVGQPVTLTVTIRSSQMWASSSSIPDTQMVYDIVPDFDNWLVSGPKRGVFTPRLPPIAPPDVSALLRNVEPYEVKITLVPLRAGSLALPTILIRPLDAVRQTDQTVTCETYTQNGAERVEVVPATVSRGVRSVAAPDKAKRTRMHADATKPVITELASTSIA